MTATTPTPEPKKLTAAARAKLEAWSKRFQQRLGEMIEAFTAEDMQLSRASFGENFTETKAAGDMLAFGLFAALSSGSTVEEIAALARHIQEERERRPTRSLIDEDDADGAELGGG